jgi:predicted PurR-regulated permease PerM
MIFPYFILALTVIVAYRLIIEVGVLFNFISRIWRIVTPFFYGFLLAYCLSIPCGGIEKLIKRAKSKFVAKRTRVFSVIITYILFFLIAYLVFYLIVPTLVSNIAYFFANINTHYDNFQYLIGLVNQIEIIEINITMNDILAMLPEFNFANLSAPLNMLFGVGSAIFTAFLALISSIYILFEKDKFKGFLCRFLKAVTSNQAYDTLLKYSRQINLNFKKYIYAQTIDGLILGTVVTIQLYLLGSEYFLLLGVMLGILNYIPYFGSIVGTIIAVFVVMLTQGLNRGLLTAAILLVTQQLDGNVLQPRLMSGSFKMSPLLVIISITIGGAFAGALGMIAAIPIVAVLVEILENIIAYYEHKKLIGGMDDGR